MSDRLRKAEFLEFLKISDVIDPEGTHHEFNQGLHGQKIDLDKILDGSDLFEEWIELVAKAIEEYYSEQLPDVLVGVASGTNRIVAAVSERLAHHPLAIETVKIERLPILSQVSSALIHELEPSFVLVVEDVATEGTNALSVVRSIRKVTQARTEILNTVERSQELRLLREAGVSYRSILSHILPTYTAEECQQSGPCAQNWRLIPYKAKT